MNNIIIMTIQKDSVSYCYGILESSNCDEACKKWDPCLASYSTTWDNRCILALKNSSSCGIPSSPNLFSEYSEEKPSVCGWGEYKGPAYASSALLWSKLPSVSPCPPPHCPSGFYIYTLDYNKGMGGAPVWCCNESKCVAPLTSS